MGWFMSKEAAGKNWESLFVQLLNTRDFPFNNGGRNLTDLDWEQLEYLRSIFLSLYLNDHYHFYGYFGSASDQERAVQVVSQLIVKIQRDYMQNRNIWGPEMINKFSELYVVEYQRDYEKTALARSGLIHFHKMWERALILLQRKVDNEKKRDSGSSSQIVDALYRALHPQWEV